MRGTPSHAVEDKGWKWVCVRDVCVCVSVCVRVCHRDQISVRCDIMEKGFALIHGSDCIVPMGGWQGAAVTQSTWWELVARSYHSQPGSRER